LQNRVTVLFNSNFAFLTEHLAPYKPDSDIGENDKHEGESHKISRRIHIAFNCFPLLADHRPSVKKTTSLKNSGREDPGHASTWVGGIS
jgi:hypothetical protein